MKQNELKLGVKKEKGVVVRFVMELTPAQSRQLKTIAFNKEITVKKMILTTFGIE